MSASILKDTGSNKIRAEVRLTIIKTATSTVVRQWLATTSWKVQTMQTAVTLHWDSGSISGEKRGESTVNGLAHPEI